MSSSSSSSSPSAQDHVTSAAAAAAASSSTRKQHVGKRGRDDEASPTHHVVSSNVSGMEVDEGDDVNVQAQMAAAVATAAAAAADAAALASKLISSRPQKKQKKQLKLWVDGCFDAFHYAHANACRQARDMFEKEDYEVTLYVGVHSDADITLNKGPPLMNERERYDAVRACKWVDVVVEGAPYVTSLAVLEEHGIDYCLHGDDLVLDANGRDCYHEVKAAGKFRVFPRTSGVSTSDIVGRILLMTKSHLLDREKLSSPISKEDSSSLCSVRPAEEDAEAIATRKSVPRFLCSTQHILDFARGSRPPTPDDVVVYVAGAFDLFHSGHVAFLRKARELGTYLVVGVHADAVVNQQKGANMPILNMHERVLSALQCRYVDEVITGAPWSITPETIDSLGISIVCAGSVCDAPDHMSDPYRHARERGILRQLESPSLLTTTTIIERILAHRQHYLERNKKKNASEAKFYETKLAANRSAVAQKQE